MCGVSGVVVLDGSDFIVTRPYVERLRDALAHRGPDGEGLWIDPSGRVGLGHRRLPGEARPHLRGPRVGWRVWAVGRDGSAGEKSAWQDFLYTR